MLLEDGVCYDNQGLLRKTRVFLGKTLLAFDLLHFVLEGQICLLL